MMICMCMCMVFCMMSVMGGGPFGALFGGLGSLFGGVGDVVSGEAFKPKLKQVTGTDKEKMMCGLGLAGRAEGRPIHHSLLTGCKSICPGYPDDVANCDFKVNLG